MTRGTPLGYAKDMRCHIHVRQQQALLARYQVACGYAGRYGTFSLMFAPPAIQGLELGAIQGLELSQNSVIDQGMQTHLVGEQSDSLEALSGLVLLALSFRQSPPHLCRLPAISLSPRLLPIPCFVPAA